MEHRNLGRTGLRVSRVCLGAMMFGGATDRRTAGAIVNAARDAGVNFIDTAHGYNKGESERIVGTLLAKDRDDAAVASGAAADLDAEA